MEQTKTSAAGLVVAALLLGIAGDLLFQDALWGINMALGLILLLAAAGTLQRRWGLRFPGLARWVVLAALTAASGFALRGSPALNALAFVFLAMAVLLGAYVCHTGQSGEMGMLGAGVSMLRAIKGALLGTFQFLRHDVPSALPAAAPARHARRGLAAGRGVLLALPVLLLFGGLLASADPIFAQDLGALFQWNLAAFWVHCFWIVLGFCLAGGVLRYVLRPSALGNSEAPSAPRVSVGLLETAIVLGALDMLFSLFVWVQFRYFFGGQATVLSTVGMTYAQYARHGFFELVTVAGLCLPLLLVLHALQERRIINDSAHDVLADRIDTRTDPLFGGLAGLLLLLLFVIMASALARMNLYRHEYGLTELRVYTTAFMGSLAAVFVWFGATVLRGQRRRFAAGAFVSAFAALVLLFAWNPDAQIVRANAALARSGHPFDAEYAASLSVDAVPALVAALPSLRPADQQLVARNLLQRPLASQSADWRSWCWGRWAARQSIARSRAHLVALSRLAPAALPSPQTTVTTQKETKVQTSTTVLVTPAWPRR